MRIVRAAAMGLCFGVRDALAAALAEDAPAAVTIHGELVHNEIVQRRLADRGFAQAPEADRAAVPATPAVLITAHGVSDRERRRLVDAGKRLVDTTCPLVRRAHRAALALDAAGYHVIVIGKPGHVEVQGLVGDLRGHDVVAGVEDVVCWPHRRLGVVCQTTTPEARAEAVVAAIRARNPGAEVRFVDTVCEPTRQRTRAAAELAAAVDVVVVVGGRGSNNTRQLVALCRAAGATTHHVGSAADLEPAWFDGVEAVGLTAGTSTLDETVEAVARALATIGAASGAG